jgi:hypothetical protein
MRVVQHLRPVRSVSEDRGGDRPLIRRVVLWRWNEAATPERKLRAKEGLAYTRFAGHVDDLDFGDDLGAGIGPGQAFDLILLRDHVDRASWDVYVNDPIHHRVGSSIDEITRTELTARIDYRYSGPAAVRGAIRHIAMYRWRDGVETDLKASISARLGLLRAARPELRALEFGEDLGLGTDHVDLVVEAHFDDVSAMRTFFASPEQQEVARALEQVTQDDRTARLQHRILSG